MANLGTPNILYINSGDGGLERTTVGDFASMMADAAGTMITMDIKASDFDGDGDLDVVVANEEVWQISGAGFGIAGARTGAMLYLNDGDGIFSFEPASFRDDDGVRSTDVKSRSCTCLETADLDGDGDVELMTGCVKRLVIQLLLRIRLIHP